ncbi:MAG: hypothetical protein WBA42_00175 [Mesorhizobium sp.]
MRSAPASVMAAVRRTLDIPRSISTPASQGFETSHPEHLETLFKVAGQTLGECPSWIVVAIERAEGRDSDVLEVEEERKRSC